MNEHDAAAAADDDDDGAGRVEFDREAEIEEWEPFAKVPNAVCESEELGADAKAIYLMLRYYARQNGGCFPGANTLCRKTRMSRPTARKALAELISVRLIDSRRRGRGQTNIYRILPVSKALLGEVLMESTFPSRRKAGFHLEGKHVSTNKTQSNKTQKKEKDNPPQDSLTLSETTEALLTIFPIQREDVNEVNQLQRTVDTFPALPHTLLAGACRAHFEAEMKSTARVVKSWASTYSNWAKREANGSHSNGHQPAGENPLTHKPLTAAEIQSGRWYDEIGQEHHARETPEYLREHGWCLTEADLEAKRKRQSPKEKVTV